MKTHRHLRLVDPLRPVTRGDCEDGPRPCAWTLCRHHLVSPSASCVLDVAGKGGRTLAETGDILGLSKERVRQIEEGALEQLKHVLEEDSIAEWKHPAEVVFDAHWTDAVDSEFKNEIHSAYVRIVPKSDRGPKALRVGKRASS